MIEGRESFDLDEARAILDRHIDKAQRQIAASASIPVGSEDHSPHEPTDGARLAAQELQNEEDRAISELIGTFGGRLADAEKRIDRVLARLGVE